MSDPSKPTARPLPKGVPTGIARYAGGKRLHPASPAELDRLREAEKSRQKWDPSYISAERAATITPEVAAGDPGLAARVRASAEDWPENYQAASVALGIHGLPGSAGEVTERRQLALEELFTGGPVGGREEPPE